MKKILLLAGLFLSLITTITAQKAEIFSPEGKAIKGYDVVAFFTASKAVEGQSAWTTEWKNATWYFSSKDNLELFTKDPEKYAPQFGGYCAFGMADGSGHKAPTSTDTWSVIDGKLYFNYNKKVQEYFNKDQQGYIKKANQNWSLQKDKE